ncbi:MAG: nucleotide exchange factor GrpE [Campylobacteraceae bacterium]|nr:nucleotide exchange factor GrpE [Campylobacteraceae bacterium]
MSKKHKDKKVDVASDELMQDDSESCEEQVAEEISEVDELKNQLKDLEDKYLRNNADFENIKKRMEKEKMMAISYAHEQFARDLLPIIDALEMASSTSEVDENTTTEELLEKVKEGVNLTIEQFRKTFEKHGIELVDIEGGFDPNFHEAVMQLESDEKPSGNILQVFQKGYKIKDRVLRPTMVSIVK